MRFMNSARVLVCFLFFSIFAGTISADFPLPFPELIEIQNVNQEEPKTLAAIETKETVELQQQPEKNPSPEVSSEISEKMETETQPESEIVSPPMEKKDIVPKNTKLPNLVDKKDKKKGKKKEDQDPSRAAYERGLLRLRNGQKDAAKEEFSKAASTEGSSSSQAAKLELSKLEDTKAPEPSTETVADDSAWKTALESARSLRSQGKNSEAESILLRVATEAGNEFRSRALLQLGDMLFRQGKYVDSRSYLMDFWNRFGKIYPNAEDQNSREYKSQREEKELGAYLLFKASYKAGEGEWAKRFLRKYLDKTVSESSGKYSPLRSEMEILSKSDL